MRRRILIGQFVAIVVVIVSGITGCARVNEGNGIIAATSRGDGSTGKIPNTTASEEARKEFLQGRDLPERLLAQESIQHFDKAISLDPTFALAELNRANVSPTAREFFEHLKKAVSLADKASEGERLLILGTEAGANGNLTKQKEILEKLVAAYPNDERAHFTLGGYYFGQQDYDSAIMHYKKATELAPSYSPAYNILGYAYRQKEDYANSEQAFQKYIELIPNDPNPYDSLAELFLKMGKFDDSIAQYRKALAIDNNFINSHLGIGAALMYTGKTDDAAAELNKILTKARNDGQRRAALFGLTVLAADSGKLDQALVMADKQYALGEKTGDVPAMAGDLQLKGNILFEMGKYGEAKQMYERSLKTTLDSNLSQEIKENAKRFHHYNLARLALAGKNSAVARTETEEFRKGAESTGNQGQIKQAHELAGIIALEEKHYDEAIAELQQANQQNPYVLYRLGLAYQGKGDSQKARESYTKAARFNSLPQLNYAFVRTRAEKMAAGVKS